MRRMMMPVMTLLLASTALAEGRLDPNKPEDIKIGAPVKAEFEQANDDVSLLFWRVVEGS